MDLFPAMQILRCNSCFWKKMHRNKTPSAQLYKPCYTWLSLSIWSTQKPTRVLIQLSGLWLSHCPPVPDALRAYFFRYFSSIGSTLYGRMKTLFYDMVVKDCVLNQKHPAWMETLKPRILPVAQNGFDLRDHYFVLTLIPDYQPCLVLRTQV